MIDPRSVGPQHNQKGEGICLAIVVSYVLTVIYRITLGLRKLVISPKILIDSGCKTLANACLYLTNTDDPCCRGLQSNQDDHFTGTQVIRISEFQSNRFYKLDGATICYGLKNIKKAIIKKICPTGPKYTFAGGCKMGLLSDPDVARATFHGKPFSHAEFLKNPPYVERISEECGHAVVITGVNTMSDDQTDHYVEIKNSYGEEWGNKGYARVAFDFFNQIMIPRLDKKCRGM